jgi:sarcosine oxidase
MYDFLIIGKGLIGSAAAKYLSAHGRTLILGPDEPADPAAHPGVFASHYDQGRITRRLSEDPLWARLAIDSIAQYGAIAAESGIRFHEPVGGLVVTPAGTDDPYLQAIGRTAVAHQIPAEPLTPTVRAARFPQFAFPAGCHALYEPPPAGYINPRDLIRAQLAIAAANGTEIVRETAVSVHPEGVGMQVRADNGRILRARRVLLATGAFSNCFDLLLEKLPLRVKTEFIILGEVSAETAREWAGMPTLIYQIAADALSYIYLLPPILYPDGRHYVKMGANTHADHDLHRLHELRDWFIRGDSDQMRPALQAALQAILPGLPVQRWQTGRCAVTYTPSGYPILQPVGEQLYVAVGGNGHAAKSSDAIGHLAAQMVRGAADRAELAPFAL